METDESCRQIESYLCQRNEGHLVRVSGPAFEMVREWGRIGIPLKVVLRGIDRHVDRAAARGPRRRPVRIEFCEADVLDAFDQWRRAVGLRPPPAGEDSGAGEAGTPAKPKRSMPAHIDRVIARLTAMRAGAVLSERWDRAIEQAVRELDVVRAGADRLRGSAREDAIARLAAIDAQLVDAAREEAGAERLADIDRDARLELEPFETRLSAEAYAQAAAACRDRLVRDVMGLPAIRLE